LSFYESMSKIERFKSLFALVFVFVFVAKRFVFVFVSFLRMTMQRYYFNLI
jgi:hypothetical protein